MAHDCEIILSPSVGDSEAPDYVDEGDFRFYTNGTFRFSNRTYPDKQALEIYHCGFHVYRDQDSRRIAIWASGGEKIVIESEKTWSGFRWLRWTPRAIDESGTPDPDPRSTRTVAIVLFVTRMWQNLVGGVAIVYGAMILLMVALVVIATLVGLVVGLLG
jgi:hypothetical protein